jgi:hypothetical protein
MTLRKKPRKKQPPNRGAGSGAHFSLWAKCPRFLLFRASARKADAAGCPDTELTNDLFDMPLRFSRILGAKLQFLPEYKK